MYRDVVYEKQVGYLTVRVMHDDTCPSPRKNDNLGDMYCYHRNFEIGKLSLEDAKKLCNSDQQISLPVFLYDHSGIELSTESFVGRAPHAEWDSGMVGWITVSKAKVCAEMGWKAIGKVRREKVFQWLAAEVEVCSQWLQGNCYYWEIFNVEGDGIDSVSGYVGQDAVEYALAEGVREAKQIIFNEEHKEEVKPNVN